MVDNLVITCEGESLNKTKINASFSKNIYFFLSVDFIVNHNCHYCI